MTYGRLLEKRRNGIYYFRQVYQANGKQVSKRFSLKTTDIKVARFLALQFKARIEMIDYKNIKRFNIEYDERGNIKSVTANEGEDSRNLVEFMKMQELHKAEAHKRDLEKLRMQQELIDKDVAARRQQEYLNSPEGQEKAALYERLQNKLKPKGETQIDQLTPLKESYINELTTTENTKYKYNSFISKFIDYCTRHAVYELGSVDRKLIYSYLLYLRKEEGKSDNTIKNIFGTLSTFFNHLIQVGETTASNPFVGHKLNVEESEREPFTNDELQKIFSFKELQKNQKLLFICLLLLTSGARPNEICQLWTDDIVVGKAITTIRITENEGRNQSLKTKSSDRVIYLNSLLEHFGFFEYLKSRKLGMLFDLKKPAKKTYSTFISEDFTGILRSLGIEKKTMYCFRHTAINRMKQHKVLQAINEDLVGHEGKGTNATVYSQQYSPEILREETEKILQYKDVPFFGNMIEI